MESNTTTNIAKRIDIRSLSLAELSDYLSELGEKTFRAKQIYQWLWQKSARSFDEMTNLSKLLREQLKQQFSINAITIVKQQHSNDGTLKFGFNLFDGHLIEGVLIPTDTRMTACVSSQVGCSLACKFCATGFLPRYRNLNPDEIYDQVAIIQQQAAEIYKKPLTNIVFMGMGEPLLNYKNVLAGIEKICSPEGLHISSKRITVSTAGIGKMIKKLADDNTKFNLALSLHAANDQKRNEIMAINESNNLSVLSESLQYYFAKTKRGVTFEYIVFNNFNDTLQDAKELVRFCRKVPSKVNLIEYNTVEGVDFVKTTEDKLAIFQTYMESRGITCTLRRSRGKDIDAACGQLANKN